MKCACERCGASVDAQDALCRACGHVRNVQRTSILPLAALFAFLAFIGAAGAAGFFGMRKYATAAKHQPRNDLIAMHPIAEKWVVDHDGECPTPERLRAERELSATSNIDDEWGSRYRITCDGNDAGTVTVTMHCDGPDRKPDTADDLVYP